MLVLTTFNAETIDSVQGDCNEYFGYGPSDLIGQPFSKLFGVKSDPTAFRNAILNAPLNSDRLQVALYDRFGQYKPTMLICDVDYIQERARCHIRLTRSSAITLQEALEPTSTPRALVSLQPPHIIQAINSELIGKFNLNILDRVKGQMVDIFPGSYWPSLVELAAEGRVVGQRYPKTDCSPHETEVIVCTPVAEAANGWIRSVLVELAPCTANAGVRDPPLPHRRAEKRGPAPQPRLERELAQETRESEESRRRPPPAPPIPTPPAPSPSGSAAVLARPRPRPRPRVAPGIEPGTDPSSAAKRPAQQVVLTCGLIHSLRGQPLPLAARAVGVSATSFKRACRKLGIDRWEYTRGPGRTLRAKARPDWQEVGPNEGATTPQGCRSAATRDSEDPELDSCDVGLNPILRARCDSAAEDWEAGDDALALGMLGRQWMAA